MRSLTLVTVNRYVQTVRHLRMRQVVWRPYLRLRRKLFAQSNYLKGRLHASAVRLAAELELRSPGPFRTGSNWDDFDVTKHLAIAGAVETREFTFLNQTERFEGRISWHEPRLSQLWKYNLQYHEYLVSLGIAYCVLRRAEAYQAFKEIVVDWQANNPLPSGDGWHPYPVSLRVVNWVMAASMFSDALESDPQFDQVFKTGLIEQLLYLSSNLEHDVGGNHLLENIKALCVGGAYFLGMQSDRWLCLGLAQLKIELKHQVLADGGHFERSPMYHAIVLEDLLVIGAVLNNSKVDWPPALHDSLTRMASFHQGMLHPDGEIALLNDSAFGIAPKARDLLQVTAPAAEPSAAGRGWRDAKHALLGLPSPRMRTLNEPVAHGLLAFPSSGYFVVRGPDTAWLIDAGPVCPDDLPAHAHADMFSYELSIGGQRWIVDSGVKEYAPGAWRDFARSTRAHNTVSVDGGNQVDVWSSFRVGRRVRPSGVNWTSEQGVTVVAGQHHGFGSGRAHTRVLIQVNSECWLVVDEVSGAGGACVENFIHFHPHVQVVPQPDGALLACKDQVVHLLGFGFSSIDIIHGQEQPLNGWYMPEFGLAQPRSTAVCATRALPSLTAYLLTTRPDAEQLRVERAGTSRICTCHIGHEILEVRWDTDTIKPVARRKQQ